MQSSQTPNDSNERREILFRFASNVLGLEDKKADTIDLRNLKIEEQQEVEPPSEKNDAKNNSNKTESSEPSIQVQFFPPVNFGNGSFKSRKIKQFN